MRTIVRVLAVSLQLWRDPARFAAEANSKLGFVALGTPPPIQGRKYDRGRATLFRRNCPPRMPSAL
jgi:hypothetical protein